MKGKIVLISMCLLFVSQVVVAESIQERLRRAREVETQEKPQQTEEKKSLGGKAHATNCGSDLRCLMTAAQTCLPAQLKRTVKNQGVVLVQAEQLLEIRGPEKEGCAIYFRHDHFEIFFTNWWKNELKIDQGLSDEEIEQVEKDENKNLNTKVIDGLCHANRTEWVPVLEKWSRGTLSYRVSAEGKLGGDLEGFTCQGALFDVSVGKSTGCLEMADGSVNCLWKEEKIVKQGECRTFLDCQQPAETKYVDCVDSKCVTSECRSDFDCPSPFGSLFLCRDGKCHDEHDVASLPPIDQCTATPCEGCKLGYYKVAGELGQYLCVECYQTDYDCQPRYQCKNYRCVSEH